MLKRLWLVISVPWSMFWLLAFWSGLHITLPTVILAVALAFIVMGCVIRHFVFAVGIIAMTHQLWDWLGLSFDGVQSPNFLLLAWIALPWLFAPLILFAVRWIVYGHFHPPQRVDPVVSERVSVRWAD